MILEPFGPTQLSFVRSNSKYYSSPKNVPNNQNGKVITLRRVSSYISTGSNTSLLMKKTAISHQQFQSR